MQKLYTVLSWERLTAEETDLLLEELLQLCGTVALRLHLSPQSLSLPPGLHQAQLKACDLLLSLPQSHPTTITGAAVR